jgi:hypothetical protein
MARRVIDRAGAQRRLCDALAAGNTRRAACAFAGISQDSLGRWLRRYADFADAIQKAEGEAELRHVAVVTGAAQAGVWQAAAWWLERRFPNDYGRTVQQVEHSGPGGGPLRLTFRIAHPTDHLRVSDPDADVLPTEEAHANGRLPG